MSFSRASLRASAGLRRVGFLPGGRQRSPPRSKKDSLTPAEAFWRGRSR